MAAKQKELYLRSQMDPDDTGDTPSSQPKRIKDKLQAKEKKRRDQLEQDVREMAQKTAKLSRQHQKEIDLQTAKQLQLEENARAAKLGKDEAKQSQIAEMDRLMEVIN